MAFIQAANLKPAWPIWSSTISQFSSKYASLKSFSKIHLSQHLDTWLHQGIQFFRPPCNTIYRPQLSTFAFTADNAYRALLQEQIVSPLSRSLLLVHLIKTHLQTTQLMCEMGIPQSIQVQAAATAVFPAGGGERFQQRDSSLLLPVFQQTTCNG